MPYTLAEAAAACGLDKSTIRRAVRGGRISGTKDDLGVWHVEPVELHRVFPPAPRTEDDTTAAPPHAPSDAATDILVAELRGMIADLRQDRDHWRTAFENQQRLLSPPVHQGTPVAHAPSTGMAPVHSAAPVERRGWWPWRRATG
jgi:hypothetical protein